MKLQWFIDSLMSYSLFPIRAMSTVGVILVSSGFIFGIYIFFERLLSDDFIAGNAIIVILILILSGFQILMLGVIGEYIWRTLSQVRNRSQYIIEKIFG